MSLFKPPIGPNAFIRLSALLILLCLPIRSYAQGVGSMPGHTKLPVDSLAFAPLPSDVLTPNTRRNTPYLKIGLRAGFNRSSYTNDVYLDNTPLDVGKVSGEGDIYRSGAGFGYQFGVDVEYPMNTGFSFIFTGEYDHVNFGASGPVREPCVNANGDTSVGSSIHDFTAIINYLKGAAVAKLDFSSFYLVVGLTIDRPLSTSLERTRDFGGGDCYYPNSGNSTRVVEQGAIPEVASLHYALRMGAGLTYPLTERLNFQPELILDFGFNAINKSPNSDLGVYMICATLRYDI